MVFSITYLTFLLCMGPGSSYMPVANSFPGGRGGGADRPSVHNYSIGHILPAYVYLESPMWYYTCGSV